MSKVLLLLAYFSYGFGLALLETRIKSLTLPQKCLSVLGVVAVVSVLAETVPLRSSLEVALVAATALFIGRIKEPTESECRKRPT